MNLSVWQRLEHGSGEWRLCLAANRWGAQRVIVHGFRLVSRLGDGVFWYMSMVALAVFGGARGVQAALHMAIVGIAAALLYRTLKGWIRRPRPFRSHADIIAHIPPLDEFSFPSGHTLHAVGFTFIALVYFPMLAPFLAPFAVLVAISRVVLGLHYPSDVIAAALIGSALASLSFRVASGLGLWA